jgi:hypothetical protein
MATQQIFHNLISASDDYRIARQVKKVNHPYRGQCAFAEYHKQKCDQPNITAAHVKIPVVVFDPALTPGASFDGVVTLLK